ncbi:MAG: TetR/AcrR family transcriptional regulator [Tabrizicola sp.]|nr:TetR/AcrR family transcriptional regulator [Tabrizicola sp.]
METSPLTREDWLNQALTELKARGHGALKAQPLAKSLNVTRGSFYHHFDSLSDFHTAVIDHWSRQSSGQIIQAAQAAADPCKALDDLLQTTFRSGQALERAIRAWSTVQPLVAKAVATVDHDRIGVAEALLIRGGVAAIKAKPRAQLLYWAAIGRLMMPYPAESVLSSAEISDIAGLMLETDVGKG